ncbi:thiol:disulfide interchange protein DsbA/DsbL [Chitinimonas viridis]|uniref:Thiol:disulfide interchange protein n=2 Tax=Chitinimonas TaxID=240411 RepID=A0ABT8BBX3_9NEIS|nr:MULTISPECIES: thiol:disulfide interchange protein DsbA/DsbL [Chitinimonas]MDN3579091.1 thiol:disulfide interchange protein DsbA/DsbL [Chitinimonas viridis]GLR12969.1 thiol:disulfide interchange protein [Chitinimonas prasina]
MNSKRLFARALLALGLSVIGASALAAGDHAGPVTKLPVAQPVATPGKIEVIEFFWFGCPHCSALEPAVAAWEKSLPPDVVLRREHVMWDGRSDMEGHTKLFVTLRTMGLLAQHQRAVFDAIHGGRVELRDEKTLFEWVAKRGINRAQFEAAYKSFGIGSQIGRAKQMTRDYRVNGVPTFIVNGKYSTSVSQAGGEQQLFAILNKLIAQERAGKK